MRVLLIIIAVISSLHANRLLIPLVSKHNTKTDRIGQKFNEVNLGIGYEYDLIDTNDYKIRIDAIILNDSYKSPMFTSTIGFDYKVAKWLRIGVDFGLSVRNVLTVPNINEKGSFDYEILPMGFIPVATVEYDRFSVSLLHVPQVTQDYSIDNEGNIKGAIVDGVTLLLVGYSF